MRRLAAQHLADRYAGVVAAAGSTVVLASGLAGNAVDAPAGGPVDPPGQLALPRPDVGGALDAVPVDPVHVRVLVSCHPDSVEAAVGAERVVREPVFRDLPARDLLDHLAYLAPLPDGGVGLVGKRAALVGLVVHDDLRLDADLPERLEERAEEVLGVAAAIRVGLAIWARCGDIGERAADVLLVIGGEEVVDTTQGVHRVDDEDVA